MSGEVKLRIPVSLKTDHLDGPENARLVLVEYGDYECPRCSQAYLVIRQLKDALGDDLLFVFRNFPFSETHPFAMVAAAAAEAGGLQGRFWEMHDMLFENQDSLDERSLLAYADALNLDLARFAEDLTSPEVQDRISSEQYGGARSGVNRTPTLFVNDVRYEGNVSYGALLEYLEGILRDLSEGEGLDLAG